MDETVANLSDFMTALVTWADDTSCRIRAIEGLLQDGAISPEQWAVALEKARAQSPLKASLVHLDQWSALTAFFELSTRP